MMDGYVKLHRKAMESAVFQNEKTWKVFCWALMRANHRPRTILFGGEQISLRAGQFICGRFVGAEECKMAPSTFRDQIGRLVELEILATKSDNRKTIFSVVKWAQYQIERDASDSKSDSNPTTGRQPADTDKNVRMEEQDRAFDAIAAFDSVWVLYPRRIGKKAALRHFIASVKTPADLDRVRVSLRNYRAKLDRDHTEERYIQHGSTWFNNWQDWEKIEPVAPRKGFSPLMMSEMEARRESHA